MNHIVYFRELTLLTILVRVILALIIGGVIGLERESKKQPAGFRTYMLVCLGAASVMMTNQYIAVYFGTGDPSRLGAQVISGIGFLGAGTIIVTHRNQVRGLTTAAGLWSAACIGLAVGIGFYEGAVVVGGAIMLIMTLFQKIDYKLMANAKVFHLYTNFTGTEALNRFVDQCRVCEIKVIDLQISKTGKYEENGIVAMITLRRMTKGSHMEVIQQLGEVEGLKYIEEI